MTPPQPRLFLVAPAQDVATIRACLEAACAVGDVASLLLPANFGQDIVRMAQAKGIAVMILNDSRRAARLGADGAQIDAAPEDYAQARAALGRDAFIGAYCASSRHLAMEMAEAGADYLAIAQTAPGPGEPLLGWCADMLEIPCVAFDPVEPDDIPALLRQRPDFIRPPDRMWASPEAAREIVAALVFEIAEAQP